jgi:hypothetical protein
VQAGPPVHVRSLGQDVAADPGSLAVCADEQVEHLVRAVGEVRDDLVLRLVEPLDGQPEAVLDVLLRGVVEDAHEVAAHDLVLRAERLLPLTGGVRHDRPEPSSRSVHERDTGLGDEVRPDLVQQAHRRDRLDALPAQVDLRPRGPQRWVPLRHRDSMTSSRQPEGQRRTGDSPACDEHLQRLLLLHDHGASPASLSVIVGMCAYHR